jgi:hypothetical protein
MADDTIALQWASVGTLRPNEYYQITLVDVTANGEPFSEYVTDTKFIVPAEFLPTDGVPHVFRWWVQTVRQTGTDENGLPVYEAAGAVSGARVFSWVGTPAAPAPQ